ncbi:MAG: hypothetical protein AB4060_21645 [Crocosphaera sp.]
MKGIQFIVDDQGQKTAVVIDLKQWGKEWETFYQTLCEDVPKNESWLHQSPWVEKLDQALEWNLNHPPQTSNLDELETKVGHNE